MTDQPWTRTRAIAAGTLAVGTLDILDAFGFYGLRGAKPIRILQSIAAGLLGRASFDGGVATAALGLGLHYLIALGIVVTYFLAARKVTALTERPLVHGVWYGVAVYLVMNLIVVPLSRAGGGGHPLPVIANGIFIHIVGVGLPAAWFASRALLRPRAAG